MGAKLKILVVVALTASTLPVAARADCDVATTGIPEDAVVAIDPGGLRQILAKSGIGLGGFYVGETFGNPSGGIKQGATYDGVLELHLNGDMQKMGLWKGLCFHANAYQIHGQSITASDIGSLMAVSSFEATPATRLFALWVEQSMFDKRIAVRFGQLAADSEFLISDGGTHFLNGTWGWPSITDFDLPSGGPAYPLATPGVRVAFTPNDRMGFLLAVFNGDPSDPDCLANPQICNNDGLDFNLDDAPLVMAEGAFKHQKRGLAGTIKLGGWNHFGEDLHLGSGAAPSPVTGNPGTVLDEDWGIYAIVDQQIWRPSGSDGTKGFALFGRIVGAPSERNLIEIYAGGGVTSTGMIPRRPDDILAIGFAYTGMSNSVQGNPGGLTYEALMEICYTMQIKTGWALKPDLQYIWQPGGTGTVGNATIVGVRSTIMF